MLLGQEIDDHTVVTSVCLQAINDESTSVVQKRETTSKEIL